MNINFIESTRNKVIQDCKKILGSASYRKKTNKTLLDGRKLILEYADNFGLKGVEILISRSAFEEGFHNAIANAENGRFSVVSDNLFSQVSSVSGSQGVVGVVPIPRRDTSTRFDEFQVILVIDGVQDPGNIGAIVRLSCAFKVDLVVLSNQCGDLWSPKSIRGGMGAQFRQRFIQGDINLILKEFQGRKIGIAPNKGQSIRDIEFHTPIALIYGSEGRGISQPVNASIDSFVHIPLSSKVDSLNVGSAVAICLYEMSRGR